MLLVRQQEKLKYDYLCGWSTYTSAQLTIVLVQSLLLDTSSQQASQRFFSTYIMELCALELDSKENNRFKGLAQRYSFLVKCL